MNINGNGNNNMNIGIATTTTNGNNKNNDNNNMDLAESLIALNVQDGKLWSRGGLTYGWSTLAQYVQHEGQAAPLNRSSAAMLEACREGGALSPACLDATSGAPSILFDFHFDGRLRA